MSSVISLAPILKPETGWDSLAYHIREFGKDPSVQTGRELPLNSGCVLQAILKIATFRDN